MLTVWFEPLVLLLIILNALFMAFVDYRDPDGPVTSFIEQSETVFLFAFSAEMLIKMITRGIITGELAYLKDPWCWLDFLVVVSGLLDFGAAKAAEANGNGESGDESGLSVLRVLRVLRPLRTVARLPGLRKIIRTFFLSVMRLVDVAAMFLFIIIIFGILGMSFLGGTLH
ncbi:unnamed protein product, partial [Amoebophrya sp. A25]|eukprot:GSA25T00013940001.1